MDGKFVSMILIQQHVVVGAEGKCLASWYAHTTKQAIDDVQGSHLNLDLSSVAYYYPFLSEIRLETTIMKYSTIICEEVGTSLEKEENRFFS